MKIAHNKSNKTTAIIWIAVAVIALAVIVTLIVGLSSDKETPNDKTPTDKATITGISVSILPKIEYLVGEPFDPNGISIKVTMSDETKTYYVNASDTELSFSGFDSSQVNESQTIQVAYRGFSTSFEVRISADPNDDNLIIDETIAGINVVSFPKGVFNVGEQLNTEEILIKIVVSESENVYYVKGNNSEVTVSGFDSSVISDEQIIHISFRGFETTYKIAIQERNEDVYNSVKGIVISVKPKTEYYVGEEFDITGLRVQVLTDKQATTFFVDASDEKLTLSGFDSSAAAENQVITVTYEGVSTTFTVNIKEKPAPAPTLELIEVVDLISTYTLEKWNLNGLNIYGAYLKLTYSDGTVKGSYETTPLLWEYVEPLSKADAPGTTEVVINYSEAGVLKSVTVTITITE